MTGTHQHIILLLHHSLITLTDNFLYSHRFSSCKSEYYSYGGAGSLTPCYGNALICSPLSTIASSGAEFCEKMGFHVASENDAEGDECFDGSVPAQLGISEPTEPLQDVLLRCVSFLYLFFGVYRWSCSIKVLTLHLSYRLFDEQSKDPSGVFMLAIFVPLFALFMAYRMVRHKFSRHSLENERHLQLLEVRRLQQESYGRTSYDDYDSDSDSVDSADRANDALLGVDENGGDVMKKEVVQSEAVAEEAASAETPLVPNQK